MPSAIAFLDTEFTDLLHPELLSLGMVSMDGRALYAQLDLQTELGQARLAASSDFVRYGGVIDLWDVIPEATMPQSEMGRRTAEYLRSLARDSGGTVEVCFDYWADWELVEYLLRESGLWDEVRDIVIANHVGALTSSIDSELAAEECFKQLAERGLQRHHALADAYALRAAYIAGQANR